MTNTARLAAEYMDLTPLSDEELLQSYDLLFVPGQRLVDDMNGDYRPANPPFHDEHGIVGGDYRVQAAVGAVAMLGMLEKGGAVAMAGGATQPLDMDDVTWRTMSDSVRARLEYESHFNFTLRHQSEGEVYAEHFKRRLEQFEDYSDVRSGVGRIGVFVHYDGDTTLDSLTDMWLSCFEPYRDNALLITSWFHVDRLKAIVADEDKWKNSKRMYLESGMRHYGCIPDAQTNFTVISAERLLATAYGEEKIQELQEAYFGGLALEQTLKRVRHEKQGLIDLSSAKYRTGVIHITDWLQEHKEVADEWAKKYGLGEDRRGTIFDSSSSDRRDRIVKND